jgi:urease accessory protein
VVEGTSSSVLGGRWPRDAGLLDLRLGCDPAGVTRPLRALAHPPVQLSRVRYDDPTRPDTAVFTLLHLGGVLAGDRVNMALRLERGAEARVRMAAATQVLRMPSGGATHALDIHLGAGSTLDWLAEPLILFGGARFSQATLVTIEPGARLALLDILVPGRLARGERYAFERYDMRLEVFGPGERLLAAERARLLPREHALGVPGVLGETPVVGSLYLLGDTLDAERLAARLHDEAEPRLGVSVLPNGCGVLVRALAATPSGARKLLLAAWGAFSAEEARFRAGLRDIAHRS